MIWRRDGFTVSDDPKLLDTSSIHCFLSSQSYWAKGRSLDSVEKTLRASLCFGLYTESGQVGFARVITDSVTFAYLCDVYVVEEYRGRNLGEVLMNCVLSHPDLKTVKWLLKTTYAESFYKRLGFQDLSCAKGWMSRGGACC